MKNTIVDKSLDNIIIFVKVLRYVSYEKSISETFQTFRQSVFLRFI